MSYLLPHLRTGWSVDQAIINEEERVVCLRFGHDHDVTCMQMDEVLAGIAEDVKNFCAIYVVDVSEVRFLFGRVDTSDPRRRNEVACHTAAPRRYRRSWARRTTDRCSPGLSSCPNVIWWCASDLRYSSRVLMT